jgi:hypothetical protein
MNPPTQPTPILITTDLDRTLIFSPRATAELGGGLPARVVERIGDRVISEMADEVWRALEDLPSHVHLVPATTRIPEQLDRINLPNLSRYRIATNGGVVIRDGHPDLEWDRKLAAASRGNCAAAAAILERFASQLGGIDLRDAGQFVYAIVDPQAVKPVVLQQIQAAAAELDWRMSARGRKLYLLPAGLTKDAAASHVHQQLTAELGIAPIRFAAGDMPFDRAMLEASDRAWVPSGSELAGSADLDPHLTITAEPGHAAAREITGEWLRLSTVA